MKRFKETNKEYYYMRKKFAYLNDNVKRGKAQSHNKYINNNIFKGVLFLHNT